MNAKFSSPVGSGTESYGLKIERIFDAPREVVFRAWTDPRELAVWYHFNDEWKIEVVEVEPRAGGKFRIGWRAPDGELWCEVGEYREVRPPERIVHTCRFEFPGMDEAETLLTVEFHEHGRDRTRLVLVHEGYRHAETRDNHEQGWPGFLDQLKKLLAQRVG
jgi:uncharacterized protein YndB with AHSA1/START domain